MTRKNSKCKGIPNSRHAVGTERISLRYVPVERNKRAAASTGQARRRNNGLRRGTLFRSIANNLIEAQRDVTDELAVLNSTVNS